MTGRRAANARIRSTARWRSAPSWARTRRWRSRSPGAGAPLWLRIPTHVARRNDVRTGTRQRVSLLASAIHVMRWQEPERDAATGG